MGDKSESERRFLIAKEEVQGKSIRILLINENFSSDNNRLSAELILLQLSLTLTHINGRR